MALVEFKRILKYKMSPEQEAEVCRRMLTTLMTTSTSEWDEYLEVEEDIPAVLTVRPQWFSEFIENVCPECRGLRSPNHPTITHSAPHYGHQMWCGRWKRYWKYKDTINGLAFRRELLTS